MLLYGIVGGDPQSNPTRQENSSYQYVALVVYSKQPFWAGVESHRSGLESCFSLGYNVELLEYGASRLR